MKRKMKIFAFVSTLLLILNGSLIFVSAEDPYDYENARSITVIDLIDGVRIENQSPAKIIPTTDIDVEVINWEHEVYVKGTSWTVLKPVYPYDTHYNNKKYHLNAGKEYYFRAPVSALVKLSADKNFYVKNFYSEGTSYKQFILHWDVLNDADGYNVYKADSWYCDINQLEQSAIKVSALTSNKTNEYVVNSTSGAIYFVKPFYITEGKEIEGTFNVAVKGSPINLKKESFEDDNTTPIIKSFDLKAGDYFRLIDAEVQLDGTGSDFNTIELGYYDSNSLARCINAPQKINGIWYFHITSGKGNRLFQRVWVEDKGGNSAAYYPAENINVRVLSDEFETEFTGTLSNKNVVSALNTMDEGKAVVLTVDSASKGIIKKELLKAIKGKDKTIVVNYNEKGTIQWVFYGKDINGTIKDIDLNTTIKKEDGSLYGCDKDVIKIAFADNGKLPGKVNFRFNWAYGDNSYNYTDKLALYYIDGQTVKPENTQCKVFNTGVGKLWTYIDITHNSTFLLSSKKPTIKKASTTATVSAGTVKVTSTKNKTVAFTKAKNKTSVTVPATVKIKGKTYKVTQINAGAFKGNKIKMITVGKNVKVIKKNAFKGTKATKLILKTKLLKKTKVKGCLIGSKIKTIQIKVSSKKSTNKKYVKTYKKYFTKTNAGRKATVK